MKINQPVFPASNYTTAIVLNINTAIIGFNKKIFELVYAKNIYVCKIKGTEKGKFGQKNKAMIFSWCAFLIFFSQINDKQAGAGPSRRHI